VVKYAFPKEIMTDYLIARRGRTGERPARQALSNINGGCPHRRLYFTPDICFYKKRFPRGAKRTAR
jgi:hypothetical protein